MTNNESAAEKAPWITYRPDLKVLDCTVRDGGLINNHLFEDDFIDTAEILCGYLNQLVKRRRLLSI